MFKKPNNLSTEPSTSKYEILGLLENPFPASPVLNTGIEDNRYNGKIYESKIRESEFNAVMENFVKIPQRAANHLRIGYIIDESFVGRGNGKSVFSVNLIDRINKEYSLDLSNNENKCFGLHIAPPPSGRCKTFDNLVDLIFESILNQKIISYCLAAGRYESLQLMGKEELLDELKTEEKIISSLNSQNWFKENEIEVAEMSANIFEKYKHIKASPDFPLNDDKRSFYNYRCTVENDFKKHYLSLKKPIQKYEFVFNDLILLFNMGGFNGAYIIVDDFERIPDFQSEKLKLQFAQEIRTFFFDGTTENAKVGFYNLLLVLHAGVPRLIQNSWAISGMEQRSSINTESQSSNIINFRKLGATDAELLLKIYLEKYRIKASSENLSPFNKESIYELSIKSEMNAAKILKNAHYLIEVAVKENVTIIDKNFVNKVLDIGEGGTEIKANDDIRIDDSEDLFKKANNSDL